MIEYYVSNEIIESTIAIAPAVLAGIIAGGAALTKGIAGIVTGSKQRKRAEKGVESVLSGLETYDQETYDAMQYKTPEEVAQLKGIAESRLESTSGLPGEDIYRERLARSQTSAQRAIQRTASDPTQALGAITDVYGRTQESIQDLNIRSAEYKAAQEQQRAQDYYQALQTGAQYGNIGQQFNAQQEQAAFQSRVSAQQQEYQYNVLNPAQARLSLYGAQMGAGMQQQQAGQQGAWSAPLQGLQAYLGAGGTFGQNK